jgi:hypothetical protein
MEALALTLVLPLIGMLRPEIELPAARVGDAVRRALVLTGMPVKEACARMGISEYEFSRQLNHRGVNLARLMMLGPVFMAHLMSSLGVQSQTEQRLERVERAIQQLGGVA